MKKDIKIRVYRNLTESSGDIEGRMKLHVERAKLIHDLVDTLKIEVKDWGETDLNYPREVVEIIVALGSAGVFTALVSAFKAWLDRNKMKEVEIEARGTTIKMKSAKKGDISAVIEALKLES